MKLILSELLPVTSIKIQPNLDNYIDNSSDLISLNDVSVNGEAYWNEDKHELILALNIQAEITQSCSITLLPVKYLQNIDISLLFSSEDDEEADYIIEDKIDLIPLIFAEILANKEYQVYHESADRDQFSEADDTHKPFANLVDDFKKN